MKKTVLASLVFGGIYLKYKSPQTLKDFEGVLKSIGNSTRAAIILGRSVYDYTYELGNIPYNTDEYHAKRSQIHYRVAKRILQLSETNKGIYLKLGQYLGNLERVVPKQFTEILCVLQDSAPSLPLDQIRIVLDEDMGRPIEAIFKEFDNKAIAAASLAQVHRARLHTGEQVAVKIQFPFLRKQTAIDLVILQKITSFCGDLLKRNKYQGLDLVKLFRTWTDTLVQQLNFVHEIDNGERTAKLFADQPIVYIPKYYRELSSERVITMEFMRGCKINEKEKITKMGFDPKQVAKDLVTIFGQMIFKFGHIYCDAHPGNILVRKNPYNGEPQIVLLDHGLYREVSDEFRINFSKLWLSLITFDKDGTQSSATKLNIHKHIQFLPLIFLYRTKESRKKLGAPITPQQRKYLRQKDLANFENINKLLQDLPPDLMFVIRASNLVSMHNTTLGGSARGRLLYYTSLSVRNVYRTTLSRLWGKWILIWRVFLFEYVNWLFRLLYT